MGKSYWRMVSFSDAVAWVERMDVPEGESDMKQWVLNRLRYERDQNVPVKPRIHKGRTFDEWYCGNCGNIFVNGAGDYCKKCGFAIDWNTD